MNEMQSSQEVGQGFLEFPSLSPFVTLNGPVYARIGENDVLELGFMVQKKNTNLNGSCHGAVLFSLLDSVMGASILYRLAPEYSVSTLNLSLNFLCPAFVGDLLIGQAVINGYSKSHIFISGTLEGPRGSVATAVATFAKIRSKEAMPNFRGMVNNLFNRA